MARVLVVDDDRTVREVVASYLGGDRAVLTRSGPATGSAAPPEVP